MMIHEESTDCFQLHDWINWEIYGSQGYGGCGRDGDWANGSCDPIDLLPADPFEMNLGITLSEMDFGNKRISDATVGWIGYSIDDYEADADDLVSGLSYYWNKTFWSSFGTQVNSESSPDDFYNVGTQVNSESSPVDFYNEVFSVSVLDVTGNGSLGALEEGLISVSGEDIHPDGDVNSLHEGLLLSLGYLGVKDLLSVERVCKSLRSVVKNDTLLWRCIHIYSPLGEKLTDVDLYQLTQRAQGSLLCLILVQCPKITDYGLKRVLDSNPMLKKLSVPGCMRLSAEGLINNLKSMKLSGMQAGIKKIKLGRHFIGSAEDFEELRLLVDAADVEIIARKQHLFHEDISSLIRDDDLAIDVEICPVCHKCRLLFDCTSESCRSKGPEHCRACSACIERCIDCGRCVQNCKYMETFFLNNICSLCSNHSPETQVLKS